MFETLTAQPQDKILALIAMFRDDPRSDKIDLGVGVYKDANGLTPVMRAIKSAEKTLWETEVTKTYTGLAGEPAFATAMIELILGAGAHGKSGAAAIATPGGTGAIRQALELIKLSAPKAKVFLSNPTWPNHPSIIKYLGMTSAEYRYFNDGGIDFDGLMTDLGQVAAGDAVLLHGCCHNPTGANLTADQWDSVIALLQTRRALPFVDLAYQGFGDGLDADAASTRKIFNAFPEMLIAASCSKNFGIYRERTGILIAKSADQTLTQGNLNFLNRQNFSFPPDHGARLVTMILNDPELRADWQAELEDVRLNMLTLRQSLADALRRETNSNRFDFIATHRGMFSRLGLTEAEVTRLRSEHGIYMVGDSRINIAGLNAKTVPMLAAAIARL